MLTQKPYKVSVTLPWSNVPLPRQQGDLLIWTRKKVTVPPAVARGSRSLSLHDTPLLSPPAVRQVSATSAASDVDQVLCGARAPVPGASWRVIRCPYGARQFDSVLGHITGDNPQRMMEIRLHWRGRFDSLGALQASAQMWSSPEHHPQFGLKLGEFALLLQYFRAQPSAEMTDEEAAPIAAAAYRSMPEPVALRKRASDGEPGARGQQRRREDLVRAAHAGGRERAIVSNSLPLCAPSLSLSMPHRLRSPRHPRRATEGPGRLLASLLW
jgi:hypothetical protein